MTNNCGLPSRSLMNAISLPSGENSGLLASRMGSRAAAGDAMRMPTTRKRCFMTDLVTLWGRDCVYQISIVVGEDKRERVRREELRASAPLTRLALESLRER